MTLPSRRSILIVGLVFIGTFPYARCVAEDDRSTQDQNEGAAVALPTKLAPSVSPATALSSVDSPVLDPQQLIADASRALESEDTDAAFKLTRQAKRLAPDDPQVAFLIARILGQRQRFPEAIQILDELAATTPAMQLPIMGQTADWMVRFGLWSEAEQRYREVLGAAPHAAIVHRSLARLLVRQGRSFEAAKHRRLLCHMGDIEEGELRQLLRVAYPFAGDTTENFDAVGPLGFSASDISHGDWEAARKRLEKTKPTELTSFAMLGRVYVNLNDYEALQDWAESATPASEAYADTWFAKGALAANQDDHVGAIRCFAEAVLRDQTDRHAYLLLSRSLAKIDDPEASTEAAQRAEWIEQTHIVGAEMAESDERDDAKLADLIELLGKLQRPLEALAWRAARVAYGTASAETQTLLSDIDQARTEQLKVIDEEEKRRFLLCGIDLNAFPVTSETKP